jgi:glycosyltransferase involved in cell wall biosynthesis
MRFYQYAPWLERAGIELRFAPLFSDQYVRDLQRHRRDPCQIARSYASRFASLLNAREYDLLWIEKELLPWIPGPFERLLLRGQVPFVLDYDDAVFHYYDQHRIAPVRWLLAGKHPALMRRAEMVVCGNPYLADFARRAGAPRVEIIPTAVDLDRYGRDAAAQPRPPGTDPRVGWIGQRSTAGFLLSLAPVFERLRGGAQFVAIGIDPHAMGLPMLGIPWDEATETEALRSLDIGIMPLLDRPFERGKCGYKLIQYMACGLPVVASPVGVNRDIVDHGVNGFLASSVEEWCSALEALIRDPALRRRMGEAGRRKVEQSYCVQAMAPRLIALLHDAAGIAEAPPAWPTLSRMR